MSKVKKVSRRAFLIGSAAIAGGVAFGIYKYKTPHPNPMDDHLSEGEVSLNPYVVINAEGVKIITSKGEMGQGVYSTMAAMVAEEMDLRWEDVKVEHGPPAPAYYNHVVLKEGLPFQPGDKGFVAEFARDASVVATKFLGLEITGGSTTIPDTYPRLRLAGAAARETLKEAAARRWNVKASSLKTENGLVIGPNGKKLAYTELAAEAAELTPPAHPKLKPKSEWKLLGKSVPRVDMAEKCTGTGVFSTDLRLPGMLFATVKMTPYFGSRLIKFDAAEAQKVPGFKKIVKIGEEGLGIVATNSWAAMQAADKIKVEWSSPQYPLEMEEHFNVVAKAFDRQPDSQLRDDGDIEEGLKAGPVIEAEYKVPYQAHATMEPMGATALVKGGKLEIWVGNQSPSLMMMACKSATGFSDENIKIHTLLMGGGFGRRSEFDFPKYAATIAKEMDGIPVSVIWSREEDMTHDYYRPLAIARFRAVMVNGKPETLECKFACPSLLESMGKRGGPSLPGSDSTIVQATWEQPYGIKNFQVSGHKAPHLLPIGAWRSVGASQNAFFMESMMSEMANSAGVDPIEMRLGLIYDDVAKKVLEKAREISEWTKPLPAGRARGVAFSFAFGVPTAEVIEIEQTDNGIKLSKVFIVADVGTALDPRNVEAQLTGGAIFGLSAAIQGEITVSEGKVEQENFDSYESLRFHQTPEFKVAILENAEEITGVGEPGTPPAAPALAEAIFNLTGKRVRELPLNKQVKFV